MPTDDVAVRKEEQAFFGFSWEPIFQVPNHFFFFFGVNASAGSKLGSGTETSTELCWCESPMSHWHVAETTQKPWRSWLRISFDGSKSWFEKDVTFLKTIIRRRRRPDCLQDLQYSSKPASWLSAISFTHCFYLNANDTFVLVLLCSRVQKIPHN